MMSISVTSVTFHIILLLIRVVIQLYADFDLEVTMPLYSTVTVVLIYHKAAQTVCIGPRTATA